MVLHQTGDWGWLLRWLSWITSVNYDDSTNWIFIASTSTSTFKLRWVWCRILGSVLAITNLFRWKNGHSDPLMVLISLVIMLLMLLILIQLLLDVIQFLFRVTLWLLLLLLLLFHLVVKLCEFLGCLDCGCLLLLMAISSIIYASLFEDHLVAFGDRSRFLWWLDNGRQVWWILLLLLLV